jgi:hypothetical protein
MHFKHITVKRMHLRHDATDAISDVFFMPDGGIEKRR